MIFKLLKNLFSFMPDLTGFKELGFKVKVSLGELYIVKKEKDYEVRFYQGFEPDNLEFGKLVDFDIPDGFIVIKRDSFKDKKVALEELSPVFRTCLQREEFIFLFNDSLDFSSNGLLIKMGKVLAWLES